MKRSRGFSLIELMIVVVILSVLAAIAVPGYQDYKRRALRSAAGSVLLEVVSKQEQYAVSNRTYATTLAELAVAPPAEVAAAYVFTMAQVEWTSGTTTMTGFTATATPAAGGVMAGSQTLSINQFGLRSPVGTW